MKSKRKPGRGGGGWRDKFVPPGANEEPARIVMFHPGSVDESNKLYAMKLQRDNDKPMIIERKYGILYEHFNATANKGRGTGTRCTAGLKQVFTDDGDWIIEPGDDPCVACYERDAGAANISIRKLHYFNVISLQHYHMVDGKKKRRDGKGFYKEAVDCGGKGCKFCKGGNERLFGRRMYWPIGPMHVEQLINLETVNLGRRCKCGGRIQPRAFLCPDPDCGDAVRDLRKEPITEKGELKQLRESSHKCPSCGYYGPLVEYPKCTDCKNPQPLSMWDCVMEIYKSGTGTQSVIMLADFEPLTVDLKAKLKDAMSRPFDWDKVSRPLSLEKQASIHEVENPFEGSSDEEPGSEDWDEDD